MGGVQAVVLAVARVGLHSVTLYVMVTFLAYITGQLICSHNYSCFSTVWVALEGEWYMLKGVRGIYLLYRWVGVGE